MDLLQLTAHLSDDDIACLTIDGEARGEGPAGWTAVAWVIKNRTRHPSWWGHTLRDVCLKGSLSGQHQFDCWDANDPNCQRLLSLDPADQVLTEIRGVWQGVMSGDIIDPTGGAVYYHTKAVHDKYDATRTQTAEIGRQVFFKDKVA